VAQVADYLVTPLVPGVKNTAAIRVAATLQPQSMPKRPAGPWRKALFVGICYEGTDWCRGHFAMVHPLVGHDPYFNDYLGIFTPVSDPRLGKKWSIFWVEFGVVGLGWFSEFD
jgi:hypothetical protein